MQMRDSIKKNDKQLTFHNILHNNCFSYSKREYVVWEKIVHSFLYG